MRIKLPKLVKTKEEARALAQEYQSWATEACLSYGELADLTNYFYALAKKFNLVREFKENCII